MEDSQGPRAARARRKIMLEVGHFEAKLREMFGFAVQVFFFITLKPRDE